MKILVAQDISGAVPRTHTDNLWAVVMSLVHMGHQVDVTYFDTEVRKLFRYVSAVPDDTRALRYSPGGVNFKAVQNLIQQEGYHQVLVSSDGQFC